MGQSLKAPSIGMLSSEVITAASPTHTPSTPLTAPPTLSSTVTTASKAKDPDSIFEVKATKGALLLIIGIVLLLFCFGFVLGRATASHGDYDAISTDEDFN